MALVNALNVAALLAYAGKYATEVIESEKQELEVLRHFQVDTAITSSKRFPKMVIGDMLGAYTGDDDTTGNEIVFSDRELKVTVGDFKMAIDPEVLRNTFAGQDSKITDGKIPMEEAFIRYYMRQGFAQFNNGVFWKGDTTLANTTPNKAKRMMDGLEKDLLAAIAATEIVPITTAAFNSGTGWGAAYTDGNTIQGIEAVWNGLKAPYRQKKTHMYLSESVFVKLIDQYTRRQSNVDYLDSSSDTIILKNTGGKCMVHKCFWLGDSQRVIAANDGAIIVGTDKPTFVSDLKIQERGYKALYLSKMVAGVRIIDTEAVSCNNLV